MVISKISKSKNNTTTTPTPTTTTTTTTTSKKEYTKSTLAPTYAIKSVRRMEL
jgi:hypothetical protein